MERLERIATAVVSKSQLAGQVVRVAHGARGQWWRSAASGGERLGVPQRSGRQRAARAERQDVLV